MLLQLSLFLGPVLGATIFPRYVVPRNSSSGVFANSTTNGTFQYAPWFSMSWAEANSSCTGIINCQPVWNSFIQTWEAGFKPGMEPGSQWYINLLGNSTSDDNENEADYIVTSGGSHIAGFDFDEDEERKSLSASNTLARSLDLSGLSDISLRDTATDGSDEDDDLDNSTSDDDDGSDDSEPDSADDDEESKKKKKHKGKKHKGKKHKGRKHKGKKHKGKKHKGGQKHKGHKNRNHARTTLGRSKKTTNFGNLSPGDAFKDAEKHCYKNSCDPKKTWSKPTCVLRNNGYGPYKDCDYHVKFSASASFVHPGTRGHFFKALQVIAHHVSHHHLHKWSYEEPNICENCAPDHIVGHMTEHIGGQEYSVQRVVTIKGYQVLSTVLYAYATLEADKDDPCASLIQELTPLTAAGGEIAGIAGGFFGTFAKSICS